MRTEEHDIEKAWKLLSDKWKKYFRSSADKNLLEEQERLGLRGEVLGLADETLALVKKDELSNLIVSLSMVAFFCKTLQNPRFWSEWMVQEKEWWTDPEKLKTRLANIKGET